MTKTALVYPMLALFLLTVFIGTLMLRLRIEAVRNGQLNPAYFRLNRGGKLPDRLAQVSQHYENLFEAPVLFYTACLVIMVLDINHWTFVMLAWGFVIGRLMHAYIHTGSNHILRRRNAFLFSWLMLIGLWTAISIRSLAG